MNQSDEQEDEILIQKQKEENEWYAQNIKTWTDLSNFLIDVAPGQKYTFNKELRQTLIRENFIEPAVIQKMVLPYLCVENTVERFTYIKSPTGTGKTLAFILPQLFFFDETYLQNYYKDEQGKQHYLPYSIILVSQHALLNQIRNDFEKATPQYLKDQGFTVRHFDKAEDDKMMSGHVLCGVPETMLKFIQTGQINLKNIRFIIVDEADNTIMNDKSHKVTQIIQKFLELKLMKWKIIVCGATIDMKGLKAHFHKHLKEPKRNQQQDTRSEQIISKQFFQFKYYTFGLQLENIYHFYEDSPKTPDQMLAKLVEIIKNTLDNTQEAQIMIFFNQKKELDIIYKMIGQDPQLYFLVERNLMCDVQQKQQRTEQQAVIDEFKNGTKRVMFCSDLMSRGMNFRKVRLVINYGIPRVTPQGDIDMKRYDQRVGRTGRMEDLGVALTIFNPEIVPVENTPPEQILLSNLEQQKVVVKLYDKKEFGNQLAEVYQRTKNK